jgi:tetratricopeptide (TPR) repeat protein
MKWSRSLCLILCYTSIIFSAVVCAQSSSDYDALVQKGKAQLQAGNADLALASSTAALKLNAERWEAYALAGGALMNLKRNEEAADFLSKAIERAPETKQSGLRDLRHQCFAAVSTTSSVEKKTIAPETNTSQAEIVLWKSIENSTNPDDFRAYVKQYPSGAFVELAKNGVRKAEVFQQAEADRVRSMGLNFEICYFRRSTGCLSIGSLNVHPGGIAYSGDHGFMAQCAEITEIGLVNAHKQENLTFNYAGTIYNMGPTKVRVQEVLDALKNACPGIDMGKVAPSEARRK